MLRTPGFGGFQLLDLHDFPGQGTSLVGVLNAFWNEKGYVTPEEYRRFCNETVPLARLAKRTWTSNETLEARIELAHFGKAGLPNCAAEWTLTDDRGRTIAEGRLPEVDVPTGAVTFLGPIRIGLAEFTAPAGAQLSVSIPGTTAANDWNLWIYPHKPAHAAGNKVVTASELDKPTLAALDHGARVVLLPPRDKIKGRPEAWQPIFWNTQWIPSGNQSLGLLCDEKHPALSAFPTAFHSDWQWHDLMNRSVAVDLSDAPAGLQPIVQIVPDWNEPCREALLFECQVGKGRLLVCSADHRTDLANRPAARQLRRSLLAYAAGPAVDPESAMTPAQIRGLLVVDAAASGTDRRP